MFLDYDSPLSLGVQTDCVYMLMAMNQIITSNTSCKDTILPIAPKVALKEMPNISLIYFDAERDNGQEH